MPTSSFNQSFKVTDKDAADRLRADLGGDQLINKMQDFHFKLISLRSKARTEGDGFPDANKFDETKAVFDEIMDLYEQALIASAIHQGEG